MPMSFMTGSIVGRRFYKQVTTREADDRNGWTVMLDYRTLKTPSKRALKLPTLGLAKAIDAEWDYQKRVGRQLGREIIMFMHNNTGDLRVLLTEIWISQDMEFCIPKRRT